MLVDLVAALFLFSHHTCNATLKEAGFATHMPNTVIQIPKNQLNLMVQDL